LRLENRLSLRHLKTIDAIDRYGSLSQAAIALGKTQPALSKALAEAEQVLGIELFERRARGVVRAARAEMVMRAACSVFAALRRLEDELDCEAAGQAGILAIGALPAAAAGLLPGVVRAFAAEPATSQLRLVEGSADVLKKQLLSGELDLMVGTIEADAGGEDVTAEALFREPFGIVARCDHPIFERPAARHFGDFETLVSSDEAALGALGDLPLAEMGLRPARGGSVNSIGYIREMLHCSDRLAVVPLLTVSNDLTRGALRLARICDGSGRTGGMTMRAGLSDCGGLAPILRCIRREVSTLIGRGVLAPLSPSQL